MTDEDKGADSATNDDSSGDESTADETSDTTELTPEQRDAQTIARAMGLDQEEKEESEETDKGESEEGESDEAESETSKESEEESDETVDSTKTSDDESETDAETKDEPESTDSDEGDAAGEEESSADDDPEITDEDVETFLDAADDRVIKSPRIQKTIEQMVKAEADRRFSERLEQTEVSQETQRLIEQGSKAAQSITSRFQKAGGVLAKLVAGEETDEEVVLDPEVLTKELGEFAVAAAVKTRQSYDNAFATAFREVAPLTGKAFTEDEAEEVIKIVQVADRIRRDPKQGETKANAYLFKESVKYLVERAAASGEANAVAAAKKRREATKRVIGNKTATNAAKAKVAKDRKGLPPKSTAKGSEESEVSPSMDSYRAMKLAGKHDEADQILLKMQEAGMGHGVPGR